MGEGGWGAMGVPLKAVEKGCSRADCFLSRPRRVDGLRPRGFFLVTP